MPNGFNRGYAANFEALLMRGIFAERGGKANGKRNEVCLSENVEKIQRRITIMIRRKSRRNFSQARRSIAKEGEALHTLRKPLSHPHYEHGHIS
jgi:hypothetical protein